MPQMKGNGCRVSGGVRSHGGFGGHGDRVHTANTASHGDHGEKRGKSSGFGAAENATNEEAPGLVIFFCVFCG